MNKVEIKILVVDDIFIIDYQMPELNGIELLELIRDTFKDKKNE